MKTASAAKIAAQFADYLETSREQPVLTTRNGKPVVMLLAVQDRADAGPEALQGAVETMIRAGTAQPGLVGLFSSYRATQPQLYLDVDRVKAKAPASTATTASAIPRRNQPPQIEKDRNRLIVGGEEVTL